MNNKQQGFTLIEIFIALVIGLVLIGGVLSVFVGMKTTTQETSSMGEMQENGRFAISILTDDLLRQNFWGDLSGSLTRSPSSIMPGAIAGDCVGGGANNSSFPQLTGAFRTLWAQTVTNAAVLGCINNAVVGSDIIQIKRAIGFPAPFIAPPNPYVVPAVVPPIVAITPAMLNNNRYYIQTGISNTSANIFAGNIAVIPAMVESRIWEYQHHIYYVRNDAIGTTGDVVPVLMQGQLQNAANLINFNLLVEGIERVHYMFGVDTDNDDVVNAYIAPNNMTDEYWDNINNIRIIAVKLFVLVRSIRPDPDYDNDNIYTMGAQTFNANGDNFRRLLFSSTVALHNARTKVWN